MTSLWLLCVTIAFAAGYALARALWKPQRSAWAAIDWDAVTRDKAAYDRMQALYQLAERYAADSGNEVRHA